MYANLLKEEIIMKKYTYILVSLLASVSFADTVIERSTYNVFLPVHVVGLEIKSIEPRQGNELFVVVDARVRFGNECSARYADRVILTLHGNRDPASGIYTKKLDLLENPGGRICVGEEPAYVTYRIGVSSVRSGYKIKVHDYVVTVE
jgi:hypothetical protein